MCCLAAPGVALAVFGGEKKPAGFATLRAFVGVYAGWRRRFTEKLGFAIGGRATVVALFLVQLLDPAARDGEDLAADPACSGGA